MYRLLIVLIPVTLGYLGLERIMTKRDRDIEKAKKYHRDCLDDYVKIKNILNKLKCEAIDKGEIQVKDLLESLFIQKELALAETVSAAKKLEKLMTEGGNEND